MDLRNRKPSEARSKLERWILKQGGTAKLAKKMGCTQASINHWCARRAIPSLQAVKKLLEISKGELTLKNILDGSKPHDAVSRN